MFSSCTRQCDGAAQNDQPMLSKALHAAAWGYLGTALKLVMQLGVQVLLARMLGPAEYGLFAIGVIVVSFALFVGDVSSTALVPREKLLIEDIRFAFTWQIIVSSAVALIVALLAAPIAGYINNDHAEWVIRTLALVCIFNAVGGVSLALLRRKVDFKRMQIAQVVGYFVGYVLLALPYALFVAPTVMALVIAWLAQSLVTSIIYFIIAPHSLRPLFMCANASELIRFGFHSAVANFSGWAMTNIDRVIVARAFPVAQVGMYSTAANLLSTPLSQVYATLQQVTFSSSSGLTNNHAGKVLTSLISLVIVFVGLGYTFSLTAAEPIVLVLYGAKWHEAVPFVEALSVTMFFYAIAGVISPLLWAQGAIHRDAKIQAIMATLIAAGSIVMAWWSVLAVAWWVAAVFGMRALFLLSVGAKLFADTRSILLESLYRGAAFLFAAGLVFRGSDWILRDMNFSAAGRFAVLMLMFVLLLSGVVKSHRMMGKAFSESIELLLGKLHRAFRKLSGQQE